MHSIYLIFIIIVIGYEKLNITLILAMLTLKMTVKLKYTQLGIKQLFYFQTIVYHVRC